MGRKGLAESFRRWSVVAYSVVLLLGSASQVFVGGDLAWSRYLAVAIPGSISLGVTFLGWSIVRDGFEGHHVFAVCKWSVGGGFSMLFVTVWILLPQFVEGVSVYNPLSIGLSTVAVGSVVGGVIGSHEQRLQRRTERLAEQNSRLDSFTRIVAHDLRNPLHVARGSLELASETGTDADFERVHDALDRMERLIDEVLAIARGGSEQLGVTRVSLPEVAERAWAGVETGEARLEVRTKRVLVGDEHRLQVLFENLLRNAVEHGLTGPRSLPSVARQGAVEHAGEPVTVTVGDLERGFYVEDDGEGIPPELRERVFEGGYSTSAAGSGLGLAIVRSIADAHGWNHRVTESSAGGARFEFTNVDVPNGA